MKPLQLFKPTTIIHQLSIIFLLITLLFLSSCEKDLEFTIDTSQLKQAYTPQDNISLQLKNDNTETIEKVEYFINDIKIGTTEGNKPLTFSFKNQKLGYQNVKAIIFYNQKQTEATTRVELFSDITPKLLTYTIVNTYPHDTKAYTQGLEFYNTILVEGTGNGAGQDTGTKGISSLRKVDYKTGKVTQRIELPEAIFGEGITILNNQLYQLTYRNNEAYVYDATTFEKQKTLPYFKPMEGWGLTNNGKHLLMSDGSEKIYTLNPTDFKEISSINVYTNSSKIDNINELEYINGKIFANIYTKDAIAIINPSNGAVEAIINCADLINKTTQTPDRDYFNGIAYNPTTQTYFVTGKNWDKIFELKINF